MSHVSVGQGSPISGSLLPPTVLVATSPALNFHVLVVALFWFGLVVFFTEEVNIGSDSQETDNVHACSLKCKSTFTHKVQVSASRRATGAVLPIWLTLFRMCFSISVILHSGAFESHRTVLIFFVLASPQHEDTSLPLFSPFPADSLRLDRRHIPPFTLSETHYLSPVVEMPAGIS